MSDEFCAGVQILLKRMESNPEEFKLGNKKWNWIHNVDWLNAVSRKEHIAITESLLAIRRREFTDEVMATLLNDTPHKITDIPTTFKDYYSGISAKHENNRT